VRGRDSVKRTSALTSLWALSKETQKLSEKELVSFLWGLLSVCVCVCGFLSLSLFSVPFFPRIARRYVKAVFAVLLPNAVYSGRNVLYSSASSLLFTERRCSLSST